MALPDRVKNVDEARARWGDLVDRLEPWFRVTDPLGDDAVAALDADPSGWRALDRLLHDGPDAAPEAPGPVVALVRSVWRVPVFVDRARADRAGRILLRAGVVGGIVLGARSLVAGYCSPAGNKPLVMTGRLEGPEQARRLAETGAFVAAVCEPGGLSPGAEGHRICVRVRLMHARTRLLANRSGRWDRAAWGEPINQHDLLATSLLFSEVLVDGLRRFGLSVTAEEAEDWLHLWRWASVLLGVEDELLPTREDEAVRLALLIRATQGAPDDDARRLVRALLGTASRDARPGGSPLAEGFCRALLGDELADGLGLSRTRWRHAVRAASLVLGPLDRVRARSSRLDEAAVRAGRRYWAEANRRGLGGGPLRYAPPDRLVT